jgi:hypothetical protein
MTASLWLGRKKNSDIVTLRRRVVEKNLYMGPPHKGEPGAKSLGHLYVANILPKIVCRELSMEEAGVYSNSNDNQPK